MEDNQESELEKKKEAIREKLKKWFPNKYYLYLGLILIFALIVRLYFFYATKGQVLWWDEAEYMLKAKSIALGTPDTGWWSGRPFLSPYLLSPFILIGFGELGIKLLMIIMSLAVLVLTYLLGKDLFNEKIALIGTLIFSMLYLNLFYTVRILPNIPELLFGMAILYFSYKSFTSNKNFLYLLIPIALAGFFVRFTIAIYPFIVLLFVLTTREFIPLKEKKFLYSFSSLIGIGIISVAGIFLVLKRNVFAGFSTAFYNAIILRDAGEPRLVVLGSYVKNIIGTMDVIFILLFLVGFFFYFYKFFLMWDRSMAKPIDAYSKKRAFTLIWIITALVIYGLLIDKFEDRYLLIIFPAVSLLAAQGLDSVYNITKKYNKTFGLILVGGLLIFGSYMLLNSASDIIKSRVAGFEDLKPAGDWMKVNSNSEEIVITNALPQNTYYSERETYPFPSTEEEFIPLIEEKSPKYMMITLYQRSPPWVYEWPDKNKDKVEPVQAYFLDPSQQQVSTVIYQFK